MKDKIAESLAILSADAKEAFKFTYELWKDRMTLTTKTREVLASIQTHITKTVSTRNIIYIQDCMTIWQMLVALNKRLAPTTRARELEVLRRYTKLKLYSKRESPKQWLQSWEETYLEQRSLTCLTLLTIVQPTTSFKQYTCHGSIASLTTMPCSYCYGLSTNPFVGHVIN